MTKTKPDIIILFWNGTTLQPTFVKIVIFYVMIKFNNNLLPFPCETVISKG